MPSPSQTGDPFPIRRVIVLLTPLVLLFVLAAALYAYDEGRKDLIASGVRIAGIDVSGLRAPAARARVQRALRRAQNRTITVVRAGQRFPVPIRRLRRGADVAGAVQQAVDASRGGGIFGRTARSLFGGEVKQDIPLPMSVNRNVLQRFVARVSGALDRPTQAANVSVNGSGQLITIPDRSGIAVQTGALRDRLLAALAVPWSSHEIRVPAVVTTPKVTTGMLAARYPTYIVVDRPGFQLRLYKHLRLNRQYGIAVGQQGLQTPAGLHHILDKEVNPSWHVPNSSWAGSLAGQTIPPGPGDPLVARWMAIDDLGDGIHGTNEPGSIGSAASHGCIRMLVPDVIQLYSQTPMGTPVYVL